MEISDNYLSLTIDQEQELLNKGYTSLPQIKNDFISQDEIDELIASRDKVYTSGTSFHKKYIKKNNIYTQLKEDLKKLAKNIIKIILNIMIHTKSQELLKVVKNQNLI